MAYHDRSDGGIFTTLCEMAFAGKVGLHIALPDDTDAICYLFNEELGACVQVQNSNVDAVVSQFNTVGVQACKIASLSNDDTITITQGDKQIFRKTVPHCTNNGRKLRTICNACGIMPAVQTKNLTIF